MSSINPIYDSFAQTRLHINYVKLHSNRNSHRSALSDFAPAKMTFTYLFLVCWLLSTVSFTMKMMGQGFGAAKVPKFKYTGNLQPGVQTPKRVIPKGIMLPDYAKDGKPKNKKDLAMPWDVDPQTPEDIERMRVSGRIAREVLDTAIRAVRPGMTTDDIDRIVHEATLERNSYPSPLNYHGFPKSCCTSINEIICHGIPDSTVIPDGAIMNIDVTIFHDGVHGDCSETVLVGEVSPEMRDLVVTTYDAWKAAINFCKPGAKYSDIGGVIEDVVKPKGYSSVKEFCGHGIGRVFHATPNVLHYKNKQRSGIMVPGHTFTIEPMICMGSAVPVTWPDKWTSATSDGGATAQFEHTLLITETGVEELTAKLPSSPKYAWED